MARRITSRRLLERESEQAALWAAFERACAGNAATCIVVGEAGIGKTRLVRELEDRVRAAGALALRGQCMELDGAELPYAPIAGALRDLPPAVTATIRAALPLRARVELSRAFPSLWPDDPMEADWSPPIDRFAQTRLFEFVLALLRLISRETPALLVVEDLHWADRSTRHLLRFLQQNLRAERLAVVLTCRDELSDEHPARLLTAELQRAVATECFKLGALSRDAVAAQVQAICTQRAPPGLADEVFARSNGNPFLAEELLAARIAGAPGHELPSTLHDALLARIAGTGRDARVVLRAAAAIGRPASSMLLAEIAGLEPEILSSALREVIQRHVLIQAAEDAFGFRHELVREAVYGELLPPERRELHDRIATSLAADEQATAWAELAFHWRAAGRPVESLAASIRAGLQAEAAHAFGEALDHFERAHTLLRAPGSSAATAAADRAEVCTHAARLARYCAQYELAIERCDEALAELDPAVEAVWVAELYELRGRCEAYGEDCGLWSFRRALAALPPGERARTARLLGAEGYALAGLRRWWQARERCEAAVAVAREVGATEEEAFARARLGLALAFLGERTAGEAHLLWARDACNRLALAEDLLYAYVFLGEVRRLQGRLDAAHAAMSDGVSCARRVGMEASFGRFLLLNGAADLVLLGRWTEADAALGAVTNTPLEPWQALMRDQVGAQLAVARGDAEAAHRYLEHGGRLCDEGAPQEYLPGIFGARAELALWHGEPEEAGRVIDRALSQVGNHADILHTPVLYSIGARACADAADRARPLGASRDVTDARARASTLLADLDTLLEAFAGAEPAPIALAHRRLCAAEQARAAGESAAEAYKQAADAWRALDVPYLAAYADWRQAEALLASRGGRPAARRALGAAHGVSERLGAEPLHREVEALAQRAHLEPEHPAAVVAEATQGTGERPLGLTARELDVLELIAQGLTNRQIAERLFISEKTAGVHVSHILGKLNARNRVSAAGIAHRLGLVKAAVEPGTVSDARRGA